MMESKLVAQYLLGSAAELTFRIPSNVYMNWRNQKDLGDSIVNHLIEALNNYEKEEEYASKKRNSTIPK